MLSLARHQQNGTTQGRPLHAIIKFLGYIINLSFNPRLNVGDDLVSSLASKTSLFILLLIISTINPAIALEDIPDFVTETPIKPLPTTTKKTTAPALTLTVKVDIVDHTMDKPWQLASEKILLHSLAIARAVNEAKLSAARIRNLHDRATPQLLDTLEALGFYHAKINADLTETNDHWRATYLITIGKPTKINKITLDVIGAGKNHAELRQHLQLPKLQRNTIITHQDYEQGKQTLLTSAHNFGFLNAKFASSQLKINRENYNAEVELILDTGKQYTFGTVSFHDSKYSEQLLKRFIPFTIGENYTANKLTMFHKNLADADLFNKIRIDPDPKLDNPDDEQELSKRTIPDTQVPIAVRLVDKPLDRFTGSVGYGTDTSFRGSLGWQHRRISQAGHRFNTGVNASGVKKQVFMSYMIPGRHAANDKYIIGSSVTQETVQKKFSRKSEISFSKVKKISNLQTFWTIQYLTENFKLAPAATQQHTKYLLPSVKASWIDAPEDTDLVYGKKLDVTLRGSLDMLLSSTDLLQGEATGKWITKFTTNSRLLARATLGYTSAKRFSTVPFSLRFFAGGDNSVRGFGYRSLGPRVIDADGDINVLGGKHLIDASVEVDQQIYQELRGAVFVDAGNAMDNFNLNLPVGAGAGLRWTTKVGVFRVDFAKQLRQIQSKNIRIHLTFGADL